MQIRSGDILTLKPRANQTQEGVRYAIKSIPHTYDRMVKETWKRAARTARGKVNEAMVLETLRDMGLQLNVEDKSYRNFDSNDFILTSKGISRSVDLKTFHVLNQFVEHPRRPFSPQNLLSGTDSDESWFDFYPMLVPKDYRNPKDLFIFAVSVEARNTSSSKSALSYPWLAFPEEPDELFLCDLSRIQQREETGKTLSVTVSWSQGLSGSISFVYERNGNAFEHRTNLSNKFSDSLSDISSFISICLDDTAFRAIRSRPISINVFEHGTRSASLTKSFSYKRFREIFPRSGYELHLIGWIPREEFIAKAELLPKGRPCYFYPERTHQGQVIDPGTKTTNSYLLPQSLNPISSLQEW